MTPLPGKALILAALAALVLAVAPAIHGCAGDDGRDDTTTDAGTKTDAGTDAGTPADAGTDAGTGGVLGDDCTEGTEAEPQGSCATGLGCVPLNDSLNLCIKECTTQTQCGVTGQVANPCVALSESTSVCLLGCDPEVIGSCRTGLACAPLGAAGNACLSDCRVVGNECAYGTECQTGGFCLPTQCNQTAPECAAGKVCRNEQGAPLCVPDCRLGGANACPAGRACNDAGSCDPEARKYYQTCGNAIGQCEAGLICGIIGEGASTGFCVATCTTVEPITACPADPPGAQCVITFQDADQNPENNPKGCAIVCTAGTTVCPTGNTCQPAGGGSLCLP